MRIAYFGGYDSNYARVRVTIKGLRANGIEVIECRSRTRFIPFRLASLLRQYLKVSRKIDVLFVCEAGQSYVPLARILAVITRKPLLLDAFISYYHVYKFEGGSKISTIKAGYYFWLDKIACRLADVVFLDTQEHIDYFVKTFGLPTSKFRYFPVGSDTDIFYPDETTRKPNTRISIFCVASFYPLHGVKYIVDAISYLNEMGVDLKCTIVGDGHLFYEVKSQAEKMKVGNIYFPGRLPIERVADMVRKSDICLGQFGGTEQADMVVPIKVYDALASGRPIVTQISRSVARMFRDGNGVVFCRPADGRAIAEKIATLARSRATREEIGSRGFEEFKRKADLVVVGRTLAGYIGEAVNKI